MLTRLGATEDSEAPGVEMLVKDIINIERGSLIKGLTVKPYMVYDDLHQVGRKISSPRVATFNLEGWSYPDPTFDCPVIRTIVYSDAVKPSWINPLTAEEIKERGFGKSTIDDPWSDWAEYDFIEFKNGDPIGVHMGEFVIGHVNKKKKSYVNLYTKVLLINGEMGYLTLETENRSKIEAELI